MQVFSITDAADQEFGLVLNTRRVTMRVRFNPSTNFGAAVPGRWSFDLAIDDEPVLYGRRIVLGVDLLAPFDFEIGRLFAWYPGTKPYEPGRVELPAGLVELYHVTEAEVDAYVASVQP